VHAIDPSWKGFPMPRRSVRRVVVVGGGVLGVAAAAHLVRGGAEVVLVTAGRLGSGASGRSLSWLNSFGSLRSKEYHRLRTAGTDRYRTLAARTPSCDFVRFDGGLTWPAPRDAEVYREHLRYMHEIGYDAVWLAPEQVADQTPGIDPAAISPEGAIFNPGEGWVDLPSLIQLLAGQIRARGGRIVEDAGPTRIEVDGQRRATGVVTAAGQRHPADVVLLATGPDVPAMLAELGITIPDGTQRAVLVRTRPVVSSLRAVLNTPQVSIRPTPHGGFVMDSDAAAEHVVGDEQSGYEIKDSAVEDLLGEASAILAGHPRLEVDRVGIGRKPIPGDGDPVLGAVEQIPGLSVAFTHSGATLALIAGELLARDIVSGEASPLLASFGPNRFQR
jgi:glycine/D-amino acid oxidase-like deaminating enzyme